MLIEKVNQKLSEELKKARIKKGLTIADASKHLNLDANRVSLIEDAPVRHQMRLVYRMIRLYELTDEALIPIFTYPIKTIR